MLSGLGRLFVIVVVGHVIALGAKGLVRLGPLCVGAACIMWVGCMHVLSYEVFVCVFVC